MYEITLGILKPDLFKIFAHRMQVIDMIRRNGLFIIDSKQHYLTRSQAEAFYAEHKNRFFYNRLVHYMNCGPVGTMILWGPSAIQRWRLLMGPTKVYKVLNEERVGDVKCEGTLRAIFGISDTRNAAHGSDSPESAAREVAFFYPAFNLPAWRAAVEPLFVRALESTSTTKKAAESGEETRSGEALEFLSPTQRTPLGFHRLRSSPLREHSSTP